MKEKHILIKVIIKIDAMFNCLSKLALLLASLLIVGITLMIFASVINRTFVGQIWLFVEEYATLALIPITYLVFSYVLRQNRHLNLDVIFNKCPYKVKIFLSIFSGLFALFVAFYMLMQSWAYMKYQLDFNVVSSGAMKTPLWGFSLCIFVSMVLFSVDLIFYILNRLIQLITNEQPLKFMDKIYEDKLAENLEVGVAEASLKVTQESEKRG